jgi:hypothetical protein
LPASKPVAPPSRPPVPTLAEASTLSVDHVKEVNGHFNRWAHLVK